MKGMGMGNGWEGYIRYFWGVMEHKNYDFSHRDEEKSFGDQKHKKTLGDGFSLSSSK